MIKLYDTVKIKKTGARASVIEIDDNNGKSVPIYLVEMIDKPENSSVTDIVFWCEYNEIEEIDCS